MSNSEAQERASLRPARKPWWRSRKAHAAHGGGGRVLLGGLGLSYKDPSSGAPLLDGVDVAFRARRITAVLDPSGLRSRALFLVLAGLEDPDSGRVVSAKPRSARQRWAGRIGAVALLGARDTLDRDLTIRQNILAPLAATGSVADWDNLVGALELTGLRTKVDARPAELAPLERFKATVARAIVSGAEAFLVTEPPVLPAHDIEELVGLLRAVADAGCTVVVATRHTETALRAHRVIMLANGTVSLDAAPPTLDAINASLERSPEDPKNLLGPIPSASPLFYEAGAAGADDEEDPGSVAWHSLNVVDPADPAPLSSVATYDEIDETATYTGAIPATTATGEDTDVDDLIVQAKRILSDLPGSIAPED